MKSTGIVRPVDELGRIVLYLVTAVVGMEMTVLSFMKAFPKSEQ